MSAWYLKYRPRQVAELHLESVRQTLQHLMTSGRFPQALLFAGPKGTGKTSASRIIGAMLNDPGNVAVVEQLFLTKAGVNKPVALQEPDATSTLTQQICTGQSFAVVEIDAASHGLVEDVRALKDRAMLPPQTGLMTVYILDEVHMMSAAAFNALLKLLEEPPAHAVFILATTELHKIPATIASRCTLVQFRKASLTEIATVYERIVAAEGVKAEPAALDRLAELADGSFRDAVKWLELAVTDGGITVAGVEQLVGSNLATTIPSLIAAVLAKDAPAVVEVFAQWRQQQVDPTAANRAVFSYLHQELLLGLQVGGGVTAAQPTVSAPVAQFLLQQLLDANLSLPSPLPHLALELKLLELIQKSKAKQSGGTPPQTGEKTTPPKPPVKVIPPEEEVEAATVSAPTPARAPAPVVSAELADPAACEALVTRWSEFVTGVAAQNSSVAALLRQAQPAVSGKGTVTISVFYSFHRDQLQQLKFVKLFTQVAQAVVGQTVIFEFQLAAADAAKPETVPAKVMGASPRVTVSTSPEPSTSSLASLATEVLM